MKGRELKLGEPIIKNFQRDAYPLLVMAANSDEYLPWAYSNFVQLMMDKRAYAEKKWYRVMYCNQYVGFQSPFLETIRLSHSYLQQFHWDICEFIKTNLDNGFYVMLSLDKYYVPNAVPYGKWHMFHDTMIYGYNENSFQVIGYGYSNAEQFAADTVPFDAFVKAYEGLVVTDNWWNDVIYTFTYQENVTYSFNLVLFKQLLFDYLSGANTAAYTQGRLPQKNKDYFEYGVNVYTAYKEYLQSLLAGSDSYDHTPVHLFAEHKQVLGMAVKYLEDQKLISPESGFYKRYQVTVADVFVRFLNLFVKAELSSQPKGIERILEKLDGALEAEKEILGELYRALG